MSILSLEEDSVEHDKTLLRQWRKCERLRIERKEAVAAHERAKRDLNKMLLKQALRLGIAED